jgi:phospholipid/cholesterol/gamma-HCH transport system substrate-binding protein
VNISKEVKVGLLALVSGVILYLGFNFLKGSDFFSPNNNYFVVYDDIGGLTESNTVMLNGLSVGRVKKIHLLQDHGNKLLVELDIDKEVILSDSTAAILASSSVLGGKAIELKIGPGNRVLQSEDTLIAAVEQNLSEMISQKITPITENVDTALVNLNILIRKFQSMSNSIDATLVNLRNTSSTLNTTLEQNQSAIAGISSNLRTLSASLNDPQTGVKPMLGKFNSFADTLSNMQLAQTVERTNQSINNLNQMLSRINQGDGTIGKLAKNDSLYNNLNQFASDLDALVVDLKANPKRYVTISVFGRRDKKDSKPKEEKQEKTERQEVSRK